MSSVLPPMRTWKVNSSVAELHFTVDAPADWQPVEFPSEVPDFTEPLAFAPVGAIAAPYAAVVFSVAARPAYTDGSLADWLGYVARGQQLDPGTIEVEQVGPHEAVGCWSAQVSDGTVMRARLAAFEDGERLVTLSCLAPDALWSSVTLAFRAMLDSFRLTAARGSRVLRCQAGETLPDSTFVATSNRSAGGKVGQEVATGADSAPSTESPRAESTAPSTPSSMVLARAAGMGSFDQDDPINARLRDRGVGLVPNLLDYDEQERWATLAPGSIRANVRVPFGWHVIDDGKRTLVFDAGGVTQVNMHLIARRGRTDATVLTEKVTELFESWPTLEWVRFEANGIECLAIRNVVVDGAPIEQAYLLRSMADDLILEMRITSTPDAIRDALDLGEFLLRQLEPHVGIEADPRLTKRKEPAWWERAQKLEQEGRLDQAERTILESIDHLGAYSQVAHLYELRAARLREQGDPDGADDAIRRGEGFMTTMASMATSGGEGAALSLEVDRYRDRHGLR